MKWIRKAELDFLDGYLKSRETIFNNYRSRMFVMVEMMERYEEQLKRDRALNKILNKNIKIL